LKKGIAILFLSVYLLSSTQLKEFLKLPVLIEHFIEHKQKDTSICFLEFLCMHYAHGNVKDADYEKDMKLPFKSLENSLSSVSFYLPASNFKQDFLIHLKEGKQQFPLYNSNYPSTFLSSIWQPPRIC
jgi:hypothetical protein